MSYNVSFIFDGQIKCKTVKMILKYIDQSKAALKVFSVLTPQD